MSLEFRSRFIEFSCLKRNVELNTLKTKIETCRSHGYVIVELDEIYQCYAYSKNKILWKGIGDLTNNNIQICNKSKFKNDLKNLEGKKYKIIHNSLNDLLKDRNISSQTSESQLSKIDFKETFSAKKVETNIPNLSKRKLESEEFSIDYDEEENLKKLLLNNYNIKDNLHFEIEETDRINRIKNVKVSEDMKHEIDLLNEENDCLKNQIFLLMEKCKNHGILNEDEYQLNKEELNLGVTPDISNPNQLFDLFIKEYKLRVELNETLIKTEEKLFQKGKEYTRLEVANNACKKLLNFYDSKEKLKITSKVNQKNEDRNKREDYDERNEERINRLKNENKTLVNEKASLIEENKLLKNQLKNETSLKKRLSLLEEENKLLKDELEIFITRKDESLELRSRLEEEYEEIQNLKRWTLDEYEIKLEEVSRLKSSYKEDKENEILMKEESIAEKIQLGINFLDSNHRVTTWIQRYDRTISLCILIQELYRLQIIKLKNRLLVLYLNEKFKVGFEDTIEELKFYKELDLIEIENKQCDDYVNKSQEFINEIVNDGHRNDHKEISNLRFKNDIDVDIEFERILQNIATNRISKTEYEWPCAATILKINPKFLKFFTRYNTGRDIISKFD